jgi:hypothetical protein
MSVKAAEVKQTRPPRRLAAGVTAVDPLHSRFFSSGTEPEFTTQRCGQ